MSKANDILAALGGNANVVELEPCITRLRVEVSDPSLVDEPGLKSSGAFGVVRSGRVVQVIVGPEADELAAELDGLRAS
ncbi:PTS glucose/sucrose transporter subunit IIB [Myceligenerans crystallogenes]|uniref:PTS glucose/sucrose transporter subunit IIB n=1 Tax=Myceligenerans crystallogenes TaxID=316335 RepID=A0ABN2N877_9MICO